MNAILENRKAYFNYSIGDKYVAGVQLIGTEVKSIKDGNLNFNDSYCLFVNDELFIRGVHVSDYSFGEKHENTRDRKLLLNKRELKKIKNTVKEKGLTIVPLKGFFSERGFFKIEIGIGKGKREFDKRETIKKRDIDRELKKV